MPLDEQLLSAQDLATRYDICIKTVYMWKKKKTGPRYMQLNGTIRYRLSDVLVWESQRLSISDQS